MYTRYCLKPINDVMYSNEKNKGKEYVFHEDLLVVYGTVYATVYTQLTLVLHNKEISKFGKKLGIVLLFQEEIIVTVKYIIPNYYFFDTFHDK